MHRVRTAVLISGTGTNMLKLIEAAAAPDYPAEIVLVISNRPDAKGIEAARSRGIPTVVVDHTEFPNREAFEAEVQKALDAQKIDLVALAGFMRILTASFVANWKDRMVNIHPSLLPRHKGLDTHKRALAAGDREHGPSVHWVSADLDAGTVIAQARFTVAPDDTPESLARHTQALEHTLYPAALAEAARAIADKRHLRN